MALIPKRVLNDVFTVCSSCGLIVMKPREKVMDICPQSIALRKTVFGMGVGLETTGSTWQMQLKLDPWPFQLCLARAVQVRDTEPAEHGTCCSRRRQIAKFYLTYLLL